MKTCGCGDEGDRSHVGTPEYNHWQRVHSDRWGRYVDFYAELGPRPSIDAVVIAIDPNKKVGPGNAIWGAGRSLCTQFEISTFEGLNEMVTGIPEFGSLHQAAYDARKDPSSMTVYLEKLEAKSHAWEDRHEQQLALEDESQRYAGAQYVRQQKDLDDKGRTSQTEPGREFLHRLVPIMSIRLAENIRNAHDRLKQGSCLNGSRYLHIIPRLVEKVELETISYITIAVTLDSVGRGATVKTKYTSLLSKIGERLAHEHMLETFKTENPEVYNKIKKYLDDPVRTYQRKIYASEYVSQGETNYEPFDSESQIALADWALACLQSVTCWFELICFTRDNKTINFLALSEEGLKNRTLIDAAAMASKFSIWPMVCPPLPWSDTKRGGYLRHHTGNHASKLIHGNAGTHLGEETYEAINRMQSTAWRVNPWIYGVIKELLATTNKIGAFVSYEKDSWMDQNFPVINPAVWELDSDDPELRKAKREMTDAYQGRQLAEKQRIAPQRVMETAARFLHQPQLFLPVYLDARGRLYYQCDTLSPQGSDFQKALLEFAEGTPVTTENIEQVRREYLIVLANTWDGKVHGYDRKSSKLSFDDRVEAMAEFCRELKEVVEEPLTTASRTLWTTAGEPFLFLATLREYFAVVVDKTQITAHAPLALDATNSGSQILGGVLRDRKLCHFCNVIPSDDGLPQDMYGVVAIEAQQLRKSVWWDQEIQRINENRLKTAESKNRERAEEGLEPIQPQIDYSVALKPEDITRSVVKRAVMCSSYGASWGSKNDYIVEELKEAKVFIGRVEAQALTNAVIKGQHAAFPILQALDRFFNTVGKLCLAQDQEYVNWPTPTGNVVRQEYREPLTKKVRTHAMGGGNFYKFSHKRGAGGMTHARLQIGWGDVIDSKTCSALAANWTHSIDASVAVGAINSYTGPVGFIHDCLVAPPGRAFEFQMEIRRSYQRMISWPLLEGLCEANNLTMDQVLENIPLEKQLTFGDVDIDDCLKSEYIFS